jgi:hypothetical protein
VFEFYGFVGCLLASGALVLAAGLLSFNLPRTQGIQLTVKLKEADA